MAMKKNKVTNPIANPIATPTLAAIPAARPALPPERSEVKGSGSGPKSPSREVSHSMIAKRAYEIYASRGFAAGSPAEDWREAERQLRAGL